MDTLTQAISIEPSSNFDISASVEFEFDQALFTMALTEAVKVPGGELHNELSHLQSPLVFKQNNDHFKSVKRELIADDVESHVPDRRHVLTIANRQPDILHLISPDPSSEACLYVKVKISLKATQRSAQQLYAEPARRSGSSPMLVGCRPDESPAFVHGRAETVSFDIVFNRRPFAKDRDIGKQAVGELGEAIKLKAGIVTLPAGVTSEIHLRPISIYSSEKEYMDDEFHVGVAFDVSEFGRSATEKLTHAQLVVLDQLLVDKDMTAFTTEKRLRDAGLPIYVFEQNDME